MHAGPQIGPQIQGQPNLGNHLHNLQVVVAHISGLTSLPCPSSSEEPRGLTGSPRFGWLKQTYDAKLPNVATCSYLSPFIAALELRLQRLEASSLRRSFEGELSAPS